MKSINLFKTKAKSHQLLIKIEIELKLIIYFWFQLGEFIEDFNNNGPGSVGQDLDKGMKLMDQYGQKIDNLESRRIEIGG